MMNRAMGTLTDAGMLVFAEFGGDLASRAIVQKIPGVQGMFDNMKIGEYSKPTVQLLLGLFADPLLRMARLPSGFRRWFRIGNTASALIALTQPFRTQIVEAVNLEDWAVVPGAYGGVNDWDTVDPMLAPPQQPDQVMDWETISDGEPAYSGY